MLVHIIEKAEEKGKLTKVNLKKYKKNDFNIFPKKYIFKQSLSFSTPNAFFHGETSIYPPYCNSI
jgi:hypothetical protein